MVKRIYDRICAAEAFVAAAFLVLMVLLIFLGGVMRMVGHPINWSGDAATAFFAWACFLCADIAWRKNSLMAIEVVTARLPAQMQTLLRLVNYAIICVFLLYLVVMGTHLSWISRARSFQGIPEVSYSWITLSLPVGALLLLVTTVLHVRAELRGQHLENRAVDVV
jgi:TRAP-type C4-dicarboxylate transport system permease small subunit